MPTTFHYIRSRDAQLATSIDLPGDASQPLPTIIMVHGLTGQRLGKSYHFVEFARRLAERGFAVVRFDQTGSGESTGDFTDLTIPRMIDDTNAVCDWLADQPWHDPNRLGFVGVSLGALPAVVIDGQRSGRAIALWAPVYDMPRVFAETAKTGLRALLEHQGWVPYRGLRIGAEFVAHLGAVDIAAALAGNDTPLLVLHSKMDQVVKVTESRDYLERCVELNRPCELIESATADHDYTEYSYRQHLLTRTIAFFTDVFSSTE
jgi:dipeptidyl aminopeptidase/acylaminoacyl peptidase